MICWKLNFVAHIGRIFYLKNVWSPSKTQPFTTKELLIIIIAKITHSVSKAARGRLFSPTGQKQIFISLLHMSQ